MKSKALLVGLLLTSLLYSCSQSGQQQTNETSSTLSDRTEYQLVGKKLLLDYGSMQAKVSYLTEQSLHWEISLPDGSLTQGDESISYKRLSPSSFFVSWVESDGTSVSQVLDLQKKSVHAYLTMAADSTSTDARGGRSAQALEGSLSELP